jgi:hypothetical protein
MRRVGVIVAALALASGAACVSNVQCRDSPDPMERQQCVATGGAPEAVGTAVAAGVAWGTVGCRVNGCNPGYTCDDESGFCEPMACSEGHGCPPAFECNYERGRCE